MQIFVCCCCETEGGGEGEKGTNENLVWIVIKEPIKRKKMGQVNKSNKDSRSKGKKNTCISTYI